jgi:7-cyano-7-deazaguanine synthase in queuosine biosynthesis
MFMSIDIPLNCQKNHLLFSGGVDSTLLLYLLLLEKQNRPELEIKCYGLHMNQHGDKYLRCKQILTKLETDFNIEIPFQIFNQSYILREFVQTLLSVDEGCVFSGCNKVLDFLNPSNYIANDTPPFRGSPFNEFHIRPFIDLDKAEIISYYIKYNILDLLDMTYSCGFDMKIACGNCYFCLERKWGLEMCGLSIK